MLLSGQESLFVKNVYHAPVLEDMAGSMKHLSPRQ